MDKDFETTFSKYETAFFEILSNAYTSYYGPDYHKKRIIDGKAILYLAFADNKLVGVSYVKRNFRRGGTAIFPAAYRQQGIAESLVKLSLIDFPKQYSILSTDLEHSHKMLSLMDKLGFKRASSIDEVKEIVGDEFHLLSNFRDIDGYLVFDRDSKRRGGEKRRRLTLTHTFELWNNLTEKQSSN
jgi:hypothetical protein